MKPEEFEVYVIPPNFMEGGTLFGGLLKTRNRKDNPAGSPHSESRCWRNLPPG